MTPFRWIIRPALLLAPGIFFAGLRARATVSVAPLFSDHAVLQRDKPIPVWGAAAPGETVAVSFDGQTQTTAATEQGRWIVWLKACPASSEGRELRVEGTPAIVFHDLLVGEVWLFSGQSNMTFPVNRADQAASEIASANLPLIRQFSVAANPADRPADRCKGSWTVCSPATAGSFTAVGFFFAREVQRRTGVPFGILKSAVGGTPIEAWMSAAGLASRPEFQVVHERWERDLAARPANQAAFDAVMARWKQQAAAAKERGGAQAQASLAAHPAPVVPANLRATSGPSVLFNGMIHPLLPFALRGIVWYQGESNTGFAGEYHAEFSTMIADWRRRFGQGDLPFYWVNLPNYKNGDAHGDAWARLRDAQTQTLTLPATGQAVAIDLGDPDNVHPTHKQAVGHRLALLAEAAVYGMSVEAIGPTFAGAAPDGATLRIRFTHAAGGLLARDGDVRSLEIAGTDGKFYPAAGRIDGDILVATAEKVTAPVAARYAWSNNPPANLYNRSGLPAVPFQSTP